MFTGSDGEVQADYFNEKGNPQYKYFYSDAESIASMMKRVADEVSSNKTKLPVDEL